ncbi:MAG: hypothetical protein ACOC80_07485 [Petrotogales bacterium]
MNKIEMPACKRLVTKGYFYLSYEIPSAYRDIYWQMVQNHEKRGIHYEKLRISQPFRPRSTGKKSQNHRINGFIQQICTETGYNFVAMKYYLKKRAIGRGYPFYTDPEGHAVPKSEADISVEEAKLLIDEIEQFAAEAGITLIED